MYEDIELQSLNPKPFKKLIKHDINIKDWDCKIYNIEYDSILKKMSKFLSDKIDNEMSPLAGIPSQFEAIFIYNSKLQRHERACLTKMMLRNTKPLSSLEILIKGLVYREIPIGTIYLMNMPNSGTSKHAYYVKSRYITGKGCALYILEWITSPTGSKFPKYKTIFAFCGSQLTPSGVDMASYFIEDINPSIGLDSFMDISQKLDLFMHSYKNENILVCGHSKAASDAQRFVAKYANKVGLLFTINGVGVPWDVHESFNADDSNKLRSEPLKILIWRTEWDPVQLTGGNHLGYYSMDQCDIKLRIFKLENFLITNVHTYMTYVNPFNVKLESFEFTKSHKDLHSKLNTFGTLEVIRRCIGFFLIWILYFLRWLIRLCVPSRSSEYSKEYFN